MCNGLFKEGENRMIKLPEDDYHQISCLIQYLYTGDFDIGSTDGRPEPYMGNQSGQFAAHLYILADKYQVPGLKSAASHKIISLCRGKLPIRAFLKAACVIYENTAVSDQDFRKQFKAALKGIFKERGADLGDLAVAIKGVMMEGGEVATDIFEAQREALFPLRPSLSERP